MDEIIKNLRAIWDLPFARDIIIVCITAILTHCFAMRKIKKERYTKYQDTVGSKIASALIAVRKIVLSTKTIEMYQESMDNFPAENANAINDIIHYPAFMTDKDTLLKMCRTVSNARGRHEPYLDLISASYLYVFERYLYALALYISNNSFQNNIDGLGTILIVDIEKLASKFDRHLVKRINQPHYRLFSRHGIMWTFAKRYVEKKYLLNTMLNKLMGIDLSMLEKQITNNLTI